MATSEAAITKLMYLLGLGLSPEQVRAHFGVDLCGEVTLEDTPVFSN